MEKEANQRVMDCQREKREFDLDIRECYFFASPHRVRDTNSETAVSITKQNDNGEAASSFAKEMAQDFCTVIMDTFLPQANPWAERRAGFDVPSEKKDDVNDEIRQQDAVIFEAIRASNFYDECAKSFRPDLAVGTVGMWIEDKWGFGPFQCQALPIREFEGSLGPDGAPDTRFVTKWVRYSELVAHIPSVTLPEEIKRKVEKTPAAKVLLRRGFWRCWEEARKGVVWHYVVMIDKKLISATKIEGEGSCPMIVARFNPMSEWFWGEGPAIQSLEDIRQHDELSGAKIDNCELSLRPPITFPDDSFTNIEGGIESGMGYAIRPGTEGAVKSMYDAPPPNVAIYDLQDLETRIKRLYFLDWPEQRGDTPPSATQWLDQMTMAQRRIGTPGMPFWREFCAPVFMRFKYLLEKRGIIKPIQVEGKSISLTPYNPAQRAAEQQEVAAAARFMEIGGAAFPEEFKIGVDGTATLQNMRMKLGADKVVVMREDGDKQAAIAGIAQLMGGATPGAPTMGAPTAPLPGEGDSGGLPSNPLEPQLRMSSGG